MKKSWKTTSAGILSILFAATFLFCTLAGVEMPGIPTDAGGAMAAIIAGVGLLTAKDEQKEDEA